MTAPTPDLVAQVAKLAADLSTYADALHDLGTNAADIGRQLQALLPAPPAPAPTPAEVVRYGRMLHVVDNVNNIDRQVSRWPLQVVQGDPWHREQLRALNAYPGTLTLRYANMVARRPTDKYGDSTCLPPGKILDSWMLRNTAGSIISRKLEGDQFVDPGNTSYQAAAAANLADVCTTQGWAGVWIDEVNRYPSDSFRDLPTAVDNTPVKYAARDAYSDAVLQFVEAVMKGFRSRGLQVWVNLGGQLDPATGYWDAWTQAVAAVASGHCIEFFVARGDQPPASLENGYWRPTLDWVTWQATAPCAAMYNAQTIEPALVTYALATYLLGLGPAGNSYFCAGRDPYKLSETVWTGDMVAARKLGRALGKYMVSGGVYMRRFEHGMVQVNPSEKPVGGLAATSGQITLNA